MKGMLVGAIMAGAILSSGCVSTMAVLLCAYPDGGDCSDVVTDVTWEVDEKIFDAVFSSDDGPVELLKGVSVEGVVTSGGSPLYQARVDLSWGGEFWTVRTDRNGRYQIHGLSEPDRCSDLHLTILHPDQRTTDPLPVKCGEQQLDYDFPLGG